MEGFLKSEYTRPIFFAVLLLLLIITLISPIKRYIYLGYQHLGVKVGINLNNIAKDDYVTWIKSQSGELESYKEAIYLNKNVEFKDAVAGNILGSTTASAGGKWIEIDLSDQRLYMKEGDKIVGNFLISSGKWSTTPTGTWQIWTKLRYTRMRGGSKALGTFYDLPNVPYTMYYNKGYGIHGAYWHNNFGHPMSHGCINMRPEEAGVVFNWASVGTRVVVHS